MNCAPTQHAAIAMYERGLVAIAYSLGISVLRRLFCPQFQHLPDAIGTRHSFIADT